MFQLQVILGNWQNYGKLPKTAWYPTQFLQVKLGTKIGKTKHIF